MITEAIYLVLLVLALALFIYSIIDNNNRVYANIVTLFMATIIFFMLAMFATSGDLENSNETIIQNTPLGLLCTAFGIISVVFGILLSIEAIIETYKSVEEEVIV